MQITIVGDQEDPSQLHTLPCPQLRQLHLQGLNVQLAASRGLPGVLHACTGLQGLQLCGCFIQDPAESAAAIAALPGLQRLWLKEGSVIGSAAQSLALLSQLHSLPYAPRPEFRRLCRRGPLG
jgi:hypothetical protein